MYTGRYTYGKKAVPEPPQGSNRSTSPCINPTLENLLPHVQMLSLADKYMVSGLADLASRLFRFNLPDNRGDTSFLDVIPSLYAVDSDSAKKLRSNCVQAAKDCFGPIMQDGAKERIAFEVALEKTPEFAKDLLHSCMLTPLPPYPCAKG